MADYGFNTNLGPQAQQPTSLSDLVQMARGVQAYQQAEQLNPLAVQKAQMDIQQAQKLNPLAVTKAEEEVKQAKTGTQEKAFDLANKKAQKGREIIGALATSEAFRSGNRSEMLKQIADTQQELMRSGYEPYEALLAITPITDKAMREPQNAASFLENVVRQSVGGQSQLGLQTPQTTTNAAGQLINVTPALNKANVLGGGNAPQPNMQPNVQPNAQVQMQPPVNPTRAQVGLTETAAGQAGEDWKQTQGDATGATQRIATFQNIKRLTPESFTSVGGERKKFLAGVAQAIGIPAYELETSSTDELVKNSKLLSLAGGNTDAARQIAEMANPNTKMTKEAINRVSDQLIAIERLKLAKSQYLAPYLNNPTEYINKLHNFNQFSDYRLFQEMTPQEVAKIKQSMSPAEQREMSQKIQQARQLGIIQ